MGSPLLYLTKCSDRRKDNPIRVTSGPPFDDHEGKESRLLGSRDELSNLRVRASRSLGIQEGVNVFLLN